MSQSYDVIIIGLGAMGSAAAFHCARRGLRTLGLEQFDLPHTLGSSHGQSRMIRLAYYEHPDYVPLLRRSYELWDELESLSHLKLLHRTGGIYMGPPTGHVVPGATRAAIDHHLPHTLLSHADLAKQFPVFNLPENYTGIFEPDAGLVRPELAVSAHAAQALAHGATLHAHEPVLSWTATDKGVTVTTPRFTFHASTLLFTSGPWTSKLLAELSIPLIVTRQIMGWVSPPNPSRFALNDFPVWGIEQPDASLAYGFPILPDSPGLKLARHFPGTPASPDTLSRQITPSDDHEIHDLLHRLLPTADGPTLALRTCMYTNSPDGHFLLDRLPTHPNVLLAAGFSGHGFKFAPVIGHALADLASTGQTSLPIRFLSLSRF